MPNFFTKIYIKKLLHLENVEIELDNSTKKHLILTGKNGSGKTSLLNALVDFFQFAKTLGTSTAFSYHQQVEALERQLKQVNDFSNTAVLENSIRVLKETYGPAFEKVRCDFNSTDRLLERIKSGDFLIAFFDSKRETKLMPIPNPLKPNFALGAMIRESKVSEFLKFLVDLKIQEALARNENAVDDANEIRAWFDHFTNLLRELFDDSQLTIEFNYKDYSFKIRQEGKRFGFNELSDGYSALINIMADLMLKMQGQQSLIRNYEREGIVFIDEIETHLHLKLQRHVMPMLTALFPNVQFIISTHSPFVLSSMKEAIAYDLERQLRLENLTDYSYESLAEGYFSVKTSSSHLQNKLIRFQELSENPNKDAAETDEYQRLDAEFKSLDQAVTSPDVIGQYLQIKLSAK